jgi:hypothetical protein
MRDITQRSMPTVAALPSVAMFSRRHIDLQRVAGALCPGVPTAAPCCPADRTTGAPRYTAA